MKILDTPISGLKLIDPIIYTDDRGYFYESYKEKKFNDLFPNINFVQDNESKSKKGVLRGLHFQTAPFDQTKLVRCIKGKVLDVVVDLRKKSLTFGMHQSFLLTGKNKMQLLIPKGFAHGFLVLSKSAIFSYKVDNYYSPEHECGINWDDPILNIDWKMDKSMIIVSEKDKKMMSFDDLKNKKL